MPDYSIENELKEQGYAYVCGVDEEQDGCISVEVYRNATKTNIELSETYKRLRCQCGA